MHSAFFVYRILLIQLSLSQNSSCYFRGDKNDDSLQRVYGVAFPDKKQMTEHKKLVEEAAKRDHRKLGLDQELFFFDELSPGNVFLLPHGTLIFNALQKLLRSEYQKRGYQEVQSPNMYNVNLWKTSGHWEHYQDDMFGLDIEKQKWALKPMNCPGHCIIFGHRERSYRELPLRMADFGVLHRNEASGALNGMTRVRKFQQDDAHHFCTPDQVKLGIPTYKNMLTNPGRSRKKLKVSSIFYGQSTVYLVFHFGSSSPLDPKSSLEKSKHGMLLNLSSRKRWTSSQPQVVGNGSLMKETEPFTDQK